MQSSSWTSWRDRASPMLVLQDARVLLAILGVAQLVEGELSGACSQGAFQHHDLMGGDMQPLGSGFRNATSALDCCRQCSETPGCNFFAAVRTGGALRGAVGPAHNCWLKESAGVPHSNADRVCGTTGTRPLPPAPPAPAPPPAAFDACFPNPTKPWCDTTKPFADRVNLLVSAMTLEEKIAQIATYTPQTVPGVPRVGLPPFSYHSEGLHGLRNSFDTLGFNATLFPQVTAMAATGNMSLIKQMGTVMLLEARALSNFATDNHKGPFGRGAGLFYWSPTMNIVSVHRSTLCPLIPLPVAAAAGCFLSASWLPWDRRNDFAHLFPVGAGARSSLGALSGETQSRSSAPTIATIAVSLLQAQLLTVSNARAGEHL